MRNPFDAYPALSTIRSDLAEYEHQPQSDDVRDILAESEEPRSLRSFSAVAIILGIILALRIINLQVVEGTKSRVLAEGNRVRSREIRAPRGEIRDINGTILASNVASFTLEIYPAELPRKRSDWETILQTVGTVTGIDVGKVADQLKNQGLVSLEPIILAEQIDREQALVWQAKLVDVPGVSISKEPRRQYATLPGLGNILGYVGRLSPEDHTRWPSLSLAADVGKTGLELTHELELQGRPGEKRIEVDAKGRVERTLAELAPSQGATLILTLDARLQQSLVTHLEEARARVDGAGAAGVVIDTHSGGILALASLPSYDSNVFVADNRAADRLALINDDRRPLLNRVVSGNYPSGSTIKPIIATAALSEGTITPTTSLDTSAGAIQIGQWRFPDWKVHGTTEVRRALADSNDIFFYALGGGWQQIPGLGPDRLKKWLTAFGFGASTGIDLPGESRGLVPDDPWKRNRFNEPWYIGDSYHLAIGQGYFLTSPLQLAMAIAAVANGGQLLTPHLIASTPPVVRSDHVAAPDILKVVREGMRQTVTDGTARTLNDLPISIAAKTGTAQFGPKINGVQKTHSWVTGFAPADQPEIAFAFLVEGGGESSDSAVPAAKEFLRDWTLTRTGP